MKGVLNLKIKFKIPKFLSTITDPKYEDSKKYLKLQKTLLKNINSDCLNLSCENLSHKSVELINAYIQENQSLRTLKLSWNDFGDKGVGKLIQSLILSKIEELVLCNNNITDKGAKSISKYIELNTHIKRIDLSINNIEQKGGFAIYNALKNNKSLSHINLEHNHIDNKLIKKIDSILILKNSMRIEKGWKCN